MAAIAEPYYRGEELFYRKIAILNINKAIDAANTIGSIKHPSLKGRFREIVVGNLIEPFLPPHIKATTGTIVDPRGQTSDQVDIILYDEQIIPPVLFSLGEGVIPYHAVVATIEVKSRLTKSEVRKAVSNARSIKALKYDCSNVQLPPVIACRKMLDIEALKMLPDSKRKKAIEQGLLIVSSPACYIFAFSSNLTKNSNSSPDAERERLHEAVDYFNNMDGNKVNIPISGLCVTDRVFTYCCNVDQQTSTGSFETIHTGSTDKINGKKNSYHADPDVVLKFISHIVSISAHYAEQRWRLPLDLYFNQPD